MSKQLCDTIEPTYQTKQWDILFWELRHLLYNHCHISKIDDRTHEITSPKPPIDLTRHRKDMQRNSDTLVDQSSDPDNEMKSHPDNIPPLFQFCILTV